MKRGKEEEEKKKLEPMFPRLHVNDADKGGGPRAPPRNKMALYEHLTTPSHRFTDHSSSPRHTNTLFPPPPGPSNQPCGVERNLTSQHLDSSASGHVTQMSSMENVTTLAHRRGDQRKTLREEDDFAVPVYDNDSSRRFQCPLEKSASGCERVNASLLRQESTSSRLDHETGVMETDDGVESHGNPNDVDDDDDSISSIDVSPDEVVGVLGQKRFWRARKAIANQQRIFAVQLFELHRLIKVQRLIASSSDVLLDEISYLGNVPVKKLLPSEFILKPPPLPQVTKHRSSDSEKTDQNKMESSAENVVGKSSNQGQQHQPSNYMPFASNPPAANGCYYPPQHPPPSGGNQQWLIPVMSPSEGLIYKPHPGPGHTGSPVCGGYYGHFMPALMIMGSFMDGGPPPFHPGVGNGYFPPYGMMNPYGSGHQQQQQPNEQMNQFVHPVNTQQQSSVNEAISQQQPTQSYPRARKSRQRSTGISPSGISGTNSFRPLSVVDDDDDDNNEPEQMMTTTTTTTRTTVTQTTRDGGGVTRVIKVVPHNAKLASENAARIFRSIQEERKHY
ncbi:PREDICTED: protein EARLY FLOWERING 3 isoform X2 [Brassica oleracea var. oleracea]|nr:PREDICTED: protein EARLY FLOWERING 3 isoform X2 [Brassica oleracea var. oleracea]